MVSKISKFISEQRKNKNMSQEDLAKLLNVDRTLISKWEHAVCIPDIDMLNKLSNIFEVKLTSILQDKNINSDKDIEVLLEQEKNKLEKQHKRKLFKIIIPISILIFILIILLIKNIYFGYTIKTIKYNYDYENQKLNIGVPKLSFMMKINERNISFKNFRNVNTLESEIKKYLKTLKYSVCNDTIYYYNKDNDYSIIEYKVKNNILYSSISYQISIGDYCNTQKMIMYQEYLGGLLRIRGINENLMSLNGDILNPTKNDINKIVINLFDKIPNNESNEFRIILRVAKVNKNLKFDYIEESNGTYEIKNGKLIYYRDNIIKKSNDINIPNISIFDIKDNKLILENNYLSKYISKVEL